MACSLFGTNPLPEALLTCYQLDPKGQTSVKFESNTKLSFKKMHLKTPSLKWRPFCIGFQCVNWYSVVIRDEILKYLGWIETCNKKNMADQEYLWPYYLFMDFHVRAHSCNAVSFLLLRVWQSAVINEQEQCYPKHFQNQSLNYETWCTTKIRCQYA